MSNTAGHKDCYLGALGGCSEKISREHYFSKAILEECFDGPILVQGLPWAKDKPYVELSPNALASKVLCETHNSLLSPYDDEALRAFRFLRDLNNKPADLVAAEQNRVLVKGDYIELWMLKAMIGSFAAGAVLPTGEPGAWSPPESWLRMLTREREMPRRCGLAVRSDVKLNMVSYASMDVALDANEEVIGCRWVFAGLPLDLALLPLPDSTVDHYRPKHIDFQRQEGDFRLGFQYRFPFLAYLELSAPHEGLVKGMHPEWDHALRLREGEPQRLD